MIEIFRSLTSGTTDLVQHMASSLPRLMLAMALFVVGVLIADICRRSVYRALSRSKRAQRMSIGLGQTTFVTVIVLATLIALTVIGIDAGSLVAGLGLTSLAISFVLRDILENTTSGILLSFSQPFSIGDFIRVGSDEGTVIDISIRSTRVKTDDGTEVFIPNRAVYTGVLENRTAFPERRITFELPVTAATDVLDMCATCARAVSQTTGVLVTPDATAHAIVDAGGTIRVRIQFWVNSRTDSARVLTQVIAAVSQRLYAPPEPSHIA